jgi:hypothetical protein
LNTLPPVSIRRLFDAPQLKVTLEPAEKAVDIELTLASGLDQAFTHDPAQVWSVPPAGFEPAPPPPECHQGALGTVCRDRT